MTLDKLLPQHGVRRWPSSALFLHFLAVQASMLGYVSGLRADELANASDAPQVMVESSRVDPGDDDNEPAPLTQQPACELGDADGDGLCDQVESTTGTRPLRADTDADGVPDGVEDTNRDGVLDPGETDPRVPGLFPGGYPHIPEPMVFDLVRGLGAKKGEVEVNNLVALNLTGGERALLWAPEVEWAVADGVAVELELPMHNRELHAVKGAFQITLPWASPDITNGVQVISEYGLDAQDWRMTALYLLGRRLGKWSTLAMVGARTVAPLPRRASCEALFNPGLYHDVTETLTVGVETNVAVGLGGSIAVASIPQVHWQITRRTRVQVGGGVTFHEDRPTSLLAARIILE